MFSRVGLGTWDRFDAGDNPERRTTLASALDAFFAGGGNLIDTSPMYGSAERVLGDLLAAAGAREKAWLATKVWTTGNDDGIRQMEESLRLLQTDRVELMQVHNLLDWRVHVKTLHAWKDAGRAKYIGVTHYEAGSHDAALRVATSERFDTLQLNLSLDEPDAATRVLGVCRERGIAFIANRPFGGGRSFARVRGKPLPAWCGDYGIANWAQFMLGWVLSHPGVTSVIPGSGDAEHVVANLGAASLTAIDEKVRRKMAAAWVSL